MRSNTPVSIFLVGAFMTLSATTFAHPTNGHLCTEISHAQDCFTTDGFCEWVQEQCIYRCDLHDSQSDCHQIKEGCQWDGAACIEVRLSRDRGLSPLRDAAVQHTDSGVQLERDAMQIALDVISEETKADATDGSVDIIDPDRGSADTNLTDSSLQCSASSPALTWPLMLGVLFLARRQTKC